MATDFAVRDEVREVCAELAKAGFEAYLVGGCVRDMILKREPKDWDVATNAKPEEVQKLFKDSVYENDFGTVLVKTEKEDEEKIGEDDPRLRGGDREKSDRIKAVEVTDLSYRGKIFRQAASGRSEIREDDRGRSLAP